MQPPIIIPSQGHVGMSIRHAHPLEAYDIFVILTLGTNEGTLHCTLTAICRGLHILGSAYHRLQDVYAISVTHDAASTG